MNYLDYLHYKADYSVNFNNGIDYQRGNALYSDGTQASFLLSSAWNPLYRFKFALNSAYNTALQNGKTITALLYPLSGGQATEFLVIVPSNYDFITIGLENGINEPYCEPTECFITHFDYDTPTLDKTLNDYLNFGMGASTLFPSYGNDSIDYIHYSTEIDGDYSMLFDFTSLREDQIARTNDGFNCHLTAIEVDYWVYPNTSITIGVGSYVSSIRESAYAQGESAGYAKGSKDGYEQGFKDGSASLPDSNTRTAFTYIGEAFNGVAGLLAIEIIPHITLGLCFSIPLTLVLIMTIFKLVKK